MNRVFFIIACLLSVGVLLSGCLSSTLPAGTVALVNDEPISFEALEAKRMVLFPLFVELTPKNSREQLREQYAYALRQLVHEKLILQFMHSKDQTISSQVVEERVEQIKADYPAGAFENMLQEEGIAEGEWRKGLYVQLMLEQFTALYIRPEIKIDQKEVETFYSTNKSEYILPEQWHFLQISGTDKKVVTTAAAAYSSSKNATAVQKDFAVSIRDIQMGQNRLPDDIAKDINALHPGQVSLMKKYGDSFRLFVMLEKIAERPLNAAEVYERVEKVLVEQKSQQVYKDWMARRVKKSTISIHSSLKIDVASLEQ